MLFFRKYSKNIATVGIAIVFLIFTITTSFKYSSKFVVMANYNSSVLTSTIDLFKEYLLAPFIGVFTDFGFKKSVNTNIPLKSTKKKVPLNNRNLFESIFDLLGLTLLIKIKLLMILTIIPAGIFCINLIKKTDEKMQLSIVKNNNPAECENSVFEKLLMYLYYVYAGPSKIVNIVTREPVLIKEYSKCGFFFYMGKPYKEICHV